MTVTRSFSALFKSPFRGWKETEWENVAILFFGRNESREGKELMFHLPAWSENIIVNVHSLSLNLLVINDYSLFLHLAMIMSIKRRFVCFLVAFIYVA